MSEKLLQKRLVRGLVILGTVSCGLTLSNSIALADNLAVKPVESGTKSGAAKTDTETDTKTGVSADTKPDTKAGASTDTKTNTADGAGETATAADDATDAGADVEENTTKLDTASSEDEDPYAFYSKKDLKLLQQHQAVQHFNASKHYMNKWETELAELELRAAIMYMPELRIAHRDYCLVALLRGKPLRALAEFCMVLGVADAIPLNEQQQKDLRTEASQAHYKKGLQQATTGKWDEAISEFLWARTYLPTDLAIHRSLAFAYASKGDFKQAEQYYKSTFQIDPNDAFAHADFAYVLSKQKGKTDEAIAEMAKAVKADPDATALHVDLGWLAESKGDLTTAEREFRASVKRSPEHSALWLKLGDVLEKEHKMDQAREAYATALQKEPSSSDAKDALKRVGKPRVVTPVAVQTTQLKPVPAAKPVESKPVSSQSGKTTEQVTPLKK